MKTLIISTVAALSIAAPAVAQSVVSATNIEAGNLTLVEQARVKFAASEDKHSETFVYLGNSADNTRFSTADVHNAEAKRIFDRLRAESQEDE